ncbi:MAG: GNAT family N-acetyltransferase [Bacteroidia bacterium]
MNEIIFLESERVILRPLTKSDLTPVYLQWLNDEEVSKFNSHATFPNTQEKMEAYYNSLQDNNRNVVLVIIDKTSNRHIGNIALQQIDWVSKNAEFAILIGNKEYWKGGYGTEAAELIVRYGFERLNLHRIYCGTIEGNVGMKKLAQVLNMKEEGVRREAIYKNGQYCNILEYGVLKNEFLVLL